MDALELLLNKFEEFIKRSVLPSSSFILFLLFFDIFLNQQEVVSFLDKEHSELMIIVLFLAFIGLSNLLSMVHQGIYDNRLKSNFNATYIWKAENDKLDQLREAVNKKLSKNNNDYLLYQTLGKVMKISKSYVDQAKSIGIILISLMLMTCIELVYILTSDLELVEIPLIIILLVLIFIEYIIGKELVKSRYRSRAIRIYTNYLEEVAA